MSMKIFGFKLEGKNGAEFVDTANGAAAKHWLDVFVEKVGMAPLDANVAKDCPTFYEAELVDQLNKYGCRILKMRNLGVDEYYVCTAACCFAETSFYSDDVQLRIVNMAREELCDLLRKFCELMSISYQEPTFMVASGFVPFQ